ncbi:MAG TPA: hypothetical protein VND70_07365 [Acidimicrobiales bacterium]|nr:hypothetical protein [Acidimicrobiales bacterium]
MELHLSDEQARELGDLLTQALGDLSSEIADTDNAAFGRSLRERRQHLQTIQEQLGSGPSA